MDNSQNMQKDIDWTKGGLPTWAKMVISVAVVLLLMLVFFRVRSFEVSGNVRYSADEIAEASGITQGDILLGVNKTSTASRLLVKLPYLEQVIIEKRLPGTIRFEVKECVAVGAAASEFGTYWLLNEEGKLLEEAGEVDDGADFAYPVIEGILIDLPTGGDIVSFSDVLRGRIAMDVLRAVTDTGLSGNISVINVEDDSGVYLIYDGRLEVRLGNAEDAEYKLQYFKAVLSKLDDNATGAVDLSFSGGERAVFHPAA